MKKIDEIVKSATDYYLAYNLENSIKILGVLLLKLTWQRFEMQVHSQRDGIFCWPPAGHH